MSLRTCSILILQFLDWHPVNVLDALYVTNATWEYQHPMSGGLQRLYLENFWASTDTFLNGPDVSNQSLQSLKSSNSGRVVRILSRLYATEKYNTNRIAAARSQHCSHPFYHPHFRYDRVHSSLDYRSGRDCCLYIGLADKIPGIILTQMVLRL